MPFFGFLLVNPIINHINQSERQQRIYLFPPFFLKNRKRVPCTTSINASFTLEATFVVPLLIIAFTSILYIIQIMNISISIQSALYEQSMKIAGYSYYVDLVEKELIDTDELDGETSLISFLENTISSAYIKNMIVDDIGEDYLNNSCIVGGYNGLHIELSPNVDDDEYDVTIYYKVKVPLNWFGIEPIRLASRTRFHKWTGMEHKDNNTEVVYMTHYGEVYHLYKDCPYISTIVYQTAIHNIDSIRSKSGSKYYPCSKCCSYSPNALTVYYTSYGTRYHIDRNCNYIEKDIIEVDLNEVSSNKRLCSKCSKRSDSK